MVSGLLMELDDHNCWTIAEAIGHRGPHRLQHLLSRAVWDDQQVADIAAAWAAGHLDDGDAVLIVDETADEKSSADCAGAARQYSGTVGGVALCQVAVTLTYATGRGHALIGRALYLPERCAADEEHRELAGVPEEVMFATKPQLAGALLDRAQSLGIRAAFVAGDEVYGGRELRRGIRQRGMGYVMAVRAAGARVPVMGGLRSSVSLQDAHAIRRFYVRPRFPGTQFRGQRCVDNCGLYGCRLQRQAAQPLDHGSFEGPVAGADSEPAPRLGRKPASYGAFVVQAGRAVKEYMWLSIRSRGPVVWLYLPSRRLQARRKLLNWPSWSIGSGPWAMAGYPASRAVVAGVILSPAAGGRGRGSSPGGEAGLI